jgi:integrase/recombinase XerD
MTAEKLTLETAVARHLAWLKTHNYAEATLAARGWILGLFRKWAGERGVSAVADLAPDILERYQRHLSQRPKADGWPLGSRTQRARLVPVRTFCRWLKREGYLAANPAEDLIMPRSEQHLPKNILTPGEVETILGQPDVTTATGLRDRVIMETLYSTGLRRTELIRLGLGDLDPERAAVMVRQGKGKKDRFCPIGERALAWVKKYLADARPQLGRVGVADGGRMFLTERGGPLSAKHLSALVTGYVARSGVGKEGSCHLFRHTLATLMLENGADLRYVQAMLGHACLQTTQLYTHVSIKTLAEVHARTHPAATLAPRPKPDAAAS